jgi:hypothetical protein
MIALSVASIIIMAIWPVIPLPSNEANDLVENAQE